jgi:small GTP-binding protein
MSKNKNKKDFSKDNSIPEFKLITLGDSGVGKTSILKRFVNQKFDEDMISTIGFGFSSKQITLKNGSKIKFKLVDTAGQENFRSLNNSYLKNAEGIFFIFSHNSRKSFENITYWIDSIKENIQEINNFKNFPAFLIGNKSDLEHKINDEEIEDFSKENNFSGYIETSAKENINIDKIFQEMGETLIKIYGYKKNKGNVKLTVSKIKKKENKCMKCEPDV